MIPKTTDSSVDVISEDPARSSALPTFPFDLVAYSNFPSPVGELISDVRPLSMIPPFPWGQWLYARVFADRCARLNGDILEAGVGRGGMSIFLGMLVRQLGLKKTVFAVDSFEGLPQPDRRRDNPYFSEGEYASRGGVGAAVAGFWAALASRGLDSSVVPVAGWFDDVLPGLAADKAFCFLHVDADLYGSVFSALEHLYDRVVPGGVVAIDDFFHPSAGALRAASEFFNGRGLSPVYHVVFPYSVFVVVDEPKATERPKRSVDGNAYSFDCLKHDEVLLTALAASLSRASCEPRAQEACELLLKMLTSSDSRSSDIYDYWRALAPFWDWIDVLPSERKPHRI